MIELRRLPVTAIVALLLTLHAVLAFNAVSQKSVTYDEILHVTGGFFYNRYNDFRIHPENGVLPQRWAALPAALSSIRPPPLENNIYWSTSDAGVVSHQFFYESGHDHWPVLRSARAMMLVFPLATGILVFLWARRLFGSAGGIVAVAMFAFDPNFMAHGVLATSDGAATFFLLASVSAYWLSLERGTFGWMALSGVVTGLAAVAKFSAVLLPVIYAALFIWRWAESDSDSRRVLLRRLPVAILAHLILGGLVIWAFYGFRYSAFSPSVAPAVHFIAPWETVLPYIGSHGVVVDFARDWRLLPEAYLYGYAWVVQSMQARSAFLAGEYSLTGWLSYFPLAFLWKTPVALLSVIPLGALALGRPWTRPNTSLRQDVLLVAPLLVLFVVYWAVSLNSKLNIGHRHLLPTYPVLFILAGGLVALPATACKGMLAPLVAGAVVIAQAIANVSVHPHYLAFFNAIAGGPTNGWRLLVDSSLDWGQDLPGLKRWLDANRKDQKVFLSYFGSGEPAYYNIRAAPLPFVNNFKAPPTYSGLDAGIYCISATMLQHVYSDFRGAWTLDNEREFQELRRFEGLFKADAVVTPPARDAGLTADQIQRGLRRFSHLRFARLCHVLRAKKPDAHVGYSILIYHLSAAEVTAATAGSPKEWTDLLERITVGTTVASPAP